MKSCWTLCQLAGLEGTAPDTRPLPGASHGVPGASWHGRESPQILAQHTLLHAGVYSGKDKNLPSGFIFVAGAGELDIAAGWAFPKPNGSSSAKSVC